MLYGEEQRKEITILLIHLVKRYYELNRSQLTPETTRIKNPQFLKIRFFQIQTLINQKPPILAPITNLPNKSVELTKNQPDLSPIEQTPKSDEP